MSVKITKMEPVMIPSAILNHVVSSTGISVVILSISAKKYKEVN